MKSHILVAVLALAGAAAASPAFGDDHSPSEADRLLTASVPITITTDKGSYDHDSSIMVSGTVANASRGTDVTLQVISPTGNIVSFAQLKVSEEGTYGTELSTAGEFWKYDGTYTIRVQYGAQSVNNKTLVELTGGVPTMIGRTPAETAECSADELSFGEYCVPYTITGSAVTGTMLDEGKALIVMVDPFRAGTLTLSPTPEVFRDFTSALVDGEMWDDVDVSGNDITVSFPAGTEKIEFYGGFVIPEFGAVALVVLAVAVVAIVATTRSRLSPVPRY